MYTYLGTVAFVLLSLTILISTRPKFIFNHFSFEKSYLLHGFTGIFSVILLNLYLSNTVIAPNDFFQITRQLLLAFLGITVLTGFIGLTSFLLKRWSKIRSIRDKFLKRSIALWLHRLSYISYVLFFLDVFTTSWLNKIILNCFILVFLFCFTFVQFLVYKLNRKKIATYEVANITNPATNISTINLRLVNIQKTLNLKPNQFVFIQSKNGGILRESHPFSIVKKGTNNEIELSIKEIGDDTKKIKSLMNGTLFDIEGPYQNYPNVVSNQEDLLLIAGGIGITVFFEQIDSLLRTNPNQKISLLWSVSKESDLFNLSSLEELTQNYKNFSYSIYTTRDTHSKYSHKRISLEVLDKELEDISIDTSQVIISASFDFTKNLKKDLHTLGYSRQQIITNDFLF